MVLSVTMPTNLRREDQSMTLSYANSSVVLLQHRNTQFGRANQKFMFDHNTGLIQAFYTDFLDKGKNAMVQWQHFCEFPEGNVYNLDKCRYMK
jgi:hypothetical protein